MKFALHFGNNSFPDGAGAARVAKLAESAGFDTLFAIDHVVIPRDYATPIPIRRPASCPATTPAPTPTR
ncbi:hypothetical protein ACFQY5_18255 [Paeniroseomonas aquatica]|uniref:hypothetical protein n=1 Tax=Paeniroseomonas aquatica TaxID=373043 RepID=UPI00361D1B76